MPDVTSPRQMDARGVMGMVACCALWGGNAVAVKFATPDLPPLGCAAIRFLIGLPVVALVCRGLGDSPWVGRPLWRLLGLHAVLTAVQITMFNWGVNLSEAGRSSVFINIHPLVVAPLAWLFLGERLGARGLFGLGSSVLGVLILLAEPLRRGGGLMGDLIVLGSGVVFGVQTIAQKKTFPLIPPATLLFAQSLLAIPLVFLAEPRVRRVAIGIISPESALWGVLYQGVGVSGVCFTLWILLLRRYPAGRLATLSFLTPLFGVGLGHLTRGEPLTDGPGRRRMPGGAGDLPGRLGSGARGPGGLARSQPGESEGYWRLGSCSATARVLQGGHDGP